MSSRDFNDIVRDQLTQNQMKTERENKEREQEIAPIETGFVNITTGKIHELLNYSIKRGTDKAKELFKQKTGIDIDELQQQAQEKLDQISNGVQLAKSQLNNKLSQATNLIQPSEAYELVEPVEEEPAEPEQTESIEIEDDL